MIRELEGADSARAFVAMAELRRLADATSFVERVAAQRREGYRLAGSFEDADAAGVAGFRVGHFLALGKVIYVDDLSTRVTYRGRGHGGALRDWLPAEAKRLECDQLHLDSGVPGSRDRASPL